MKEPLRVSLVIPVYNEGGSVSGLIETIRQQSFQPAEFIIVDGGSSDNTVQLILEAIGNDQRFRVINAGRAMPGKGRNEGVKHGTCEWIAFTDAGIKLDKNWLRNLVRKQEEQPEASIVYGNYSPQVHSFFEKCALITYVPPSVPGKITGKFIASCLMKKEVWQKAGGFPDWRAAEDLVLMEKAEQLGYKIAFAPDAMVHWQLRQDIQSTYKRFDLYSKWNVWAGRQAFWHYGVARQYALMIIPLLLSIFHSGYWLLVIPAWILARAAKRILLHRYQFGINTLFNPAILFMVAIITVVIDAATFSGWVKAVLNKNQVNKPSSE